MMREEEKYTTLDTEQCKWWVNHLFNMAKEKACNSHNFDDAQEIQSAQDKIIKSIEQKSCEDAVSRKAVVELVEGWWLGHTKEDDLATEVRDLPSVTPTRKKGKWIYDYSNPVSTFYHCSECGRKLAMFNDYCQTLSDYPYCHCGAEMESEE